MIISRFAGLVRAWSYAYGINPGAPAALQVLSGSTVSGTFTLTCQPQASVNPDQASCVPTSTTPITIGAGSNTETVTPSAVATDNLGNILITATFSNAHAAGEQVRSGSFGLQEAINAANGFNGGTVIIDPEWKNGGGTQAMVVAATFAPNVGLMDTRFGSEYGSFTYTLTSTQILNMTTTSVELLPPPGANNYWQVLNANLVSIGAGTAYAAGSAITIGYGSTVPTDALSGTIAAAFLTTSTGVEVIQVGAGLTSATAGTAVLNKGIYIASGTTAFTTGNGTLQVQLQVANINS